MYKVTPKCVCVSFLSYPGMCYLGDPFLDCADLAGINRVCLRNDLVVLDLQAMPG